MVCPFVIAVDSREQWPYRFTGLHADADQGHVPIVVATTRAYLETGDYTIPGFETEIAVERKSLADLYSTLGSRRVPFAAEHERLAAMQHAIVVVEADWFDVAMPPPGRSQLSPKTVFRTAVSWQVRYQVPWIMAGTRRFAEIWTFRFLEKSWWSVTHERNRAAKEK